MRCLSVLCAAAWLAASTSAQFALPFPRLDTELFADELRVADLDDDARPDVLVVAYVFPDDVVQVFGGDGWGDFDVTTTVVGTPLLQRPEGLDAGDVDGAHELDIVTLTADGTIVVLLADGLGGYDAAPSFVVEDAAELVLGDVDGDGFADLVVERAAPSSDVVVLLGDGGGGFAQASTVPVGEITDMTLADLDGDRRIDLVVVGFTEVAVWLGDGAGSFADPIAQPLGGIPRDLAVGDVDADGRPDIAVNVTSGVAFVRGLGGALAAPVLLDDAVGPGESVVDVAIADVDDDGFEDIVGVTNGTASSPGALRVFAGDPFARPSLARLQAFDVGVSDIELADLDVDGELDVVVGTGSSVTWARGLGGGRFDATWTSHACDLDPRSLDLHDMDGDGDLDALVQHQFEEDATVVVATVADGESECADVLPPGPPVVSDARAGDVDGDGVPEVLRVGLSAELWASNGAGGWVLVSTPALPLGDPTFVDLDADGHIDLVGGGLVQYGDGTGAFPTSDTYDAAGNEAVAVIDVDADGHLDVVLAGSEIVKVVFFGPRHEIVTWGAVRHASSLGVGDFDGDGDVDVAVGQGAGAQGGDGAAVFVLYGDGARAVERTSEYGVGGAVVDMEVVDIDADGELDLVLADGSAQVVAVLSGTSDGFGGVRRYQTRGARAVEVGDMDGDGLADVVTVGEFVSQTSVLRARSPAPTSPVAGGVSGRRGEPLFKLQSTLEAAAPATLLAANAPASASGFVVLGFTEIAAPFAGGVLVPAVDVLVSGVVTDGDGCWSVDGLWPRDVPPGTTFWLQAWFDDPTGPFGWSASDGVKVVVP